VGNLDALISRAQLRARMRVARSLVTLVLLPLLVAASACGGSPAAPGPGAARPTTFYVASSGSDSSAGTIGAPWRTLRYAVSRLSAGDTLYIRGGVYSSASDTIDSQAGAVPSGSSWTSPITIAGHPGEAVAIRPPDGAPAIRLTTGAPHYLIFQDLILDMSAQSDNINPAFADSSEAIYVAGGAHHIRFQRLDVGFTMSHAIQWSTSGVGPAYSSFLELLDSRIHHAGTASGDSNHGGFGINNGYGIYTFTDDNLLAGNEFYNNYGYAINLYGSRNTIRNNRIHDNGLAGGTNYGINIGSSSYPLNSVDNVVRDNTIFNNRGGILVYTNAQNTRIMNNTVYDNQPLEGILIQFASGSTVTNNNVYGNGTNVVDLGTSSSIR